MRRIYVAGAITPTGPGHPVIEFLNNQRRGIRTAVDLLLRGYAPYCPFLDNLYWLTLREGEEIPPSTIYEVSLAMLEMCDALLLVPGWERSEGTRNELERARQLDIPIFHNQQALDAYFDGRSRGKGKKR